MNVLSPTSWLLEQEARALLTRLDRVKPFALQIDLRPRSGGFTRSADWH